MIGIVMGSTSDWETMKAAAKMLDDFGVPYEAKAMSAHRTPELVAEWATLRQQELQGLWARAARLEPLTRLDPLP